MSPRAKTSPASTFYARILGLVTGGAPSADDVDVEAVAARLRAAYVQAFDDTVTIARRWARTNERTVLEENFPHLRATNILERICAEGEIAMVQRAPESRARDLALVRRTIDHCEDFERRYPVLSAGTS
jgi:hypothetical protein